MKKIYMLLQFFFLSIIIYDGNSNNFSSTLIDARQLYNTIITNFNNHFSKFISTPNSFLAIKGEFWRPKENPKFDQMTAQFKRDVSDKIEEELKTISQNLGSQMQNAGNPTLNMQLYQDPAYLELVQFMQTPVYQNWYQSMITPPSNNPFENMDNEFKENIAQAKNSFDCENVLPNQAEACEKNHRSFLVTKNQATANKYIPIMNTAARRNGEKLRQVFDAFTAIVRRLKYPNDNQVKLSALETFKSLCGALESLTPAIQASKSWSNDYYFDLAETGN